MTSTKRLTRHEIQEPDSFVSGLDQAVRFSRSHRTGLVLGAAALVVVALATLAFTAWARARDRRANQALERLIELGQRPVAGETAAPGAGKTGEPFADAATRDQAILAEADKVIVEVGGAEVVAAARMLRAEALSRLGRPAEAAEMYDQVAGAVPTTALGAAAAVARAEARAAAGGLDAAVEELKRLATSGNPHIPKDLTLKKAAALLEGAGQAAAAVQLYKRVADEVPDSPLASQARAKAEELAEAAAVPGSPAAPAPDAPGLRGEEAQGGVGATPVQTP